MREASEGTDDSTDTGDKEGQFDVCATNAENNNEHVERA